MAKQAKTPVLIEEKLPQEREPRDKKLPPEPLPLDEVHRQLLALPSHTPNAKRLAGRDAASAFCLIVDSILHAYRQLEARLAELESVK